MIIGACDPLVSIAIITYNQKELLRECIESCLIQDYPNIEIVVADDASSDGTQEMLREYESRYQGKFVLKLAERNQGITKNCNVAHFACTGKYIAWLGGDDLMLPGKIKEQVQFMENNPNCSISYHDTEVFDNKTNRTMYISSEKSKPYEGDISISIKYGVFNGACSTMIRRDVAPENGFDIRLPVASDWLFWIECLESGGLIKYIKKTLGRHRRHENNVTNKRINFSQGDLDHLNTCMIILHKYPHFFKEVMHIYALQIRQFRHFLPYSTALWFVLRNKFDLKVCLALIIFYVSFKKIRL